MYSNSFQEDHYFKLYANCIPVDGLSRSVICDLQRNQFDFISNELYHFLKEYNACKIKTIKKDFEEKSKSTIDDYLNYLHKKNYIFFCDEVEVDWFPALDMTWQSPSLIENAIIDFDNQSKHNFKSIAAQLEELGCRAIEFRFFCSYGLDKLDEILTLLEKSKIAIVNIIIPSDPKNSITSIISLLKKHPRINSLLLHSSPPDENEKHKDFDNELAEKIVFTDQVIDSSAHCGFISPLYFRLNIKSFTETLHYNNCLNKKISIDINGDIRNCPAMPESYGNIANTTLQEALKMEGIMDNWSIAKDQIQTCKTCEFRYICSDCRAFTTNQSDSYAKPLKCHYDPKTMSWNN